HRVLPRPYMGAARRERRHRPRPRRLLLQVPALALRAQPVPEDGVAGGAMAGARELRPQLPDRAVPLGDDLVRVDRLEVDLARLDEVPVVELRQLVEDALERDAHRVLDEARLKVGVLDDEQLVRPLEELVDRRAHRALDDLDEALRVDDPRAGADEERAAAALV